MDMRHHQVSISSSARRTISPLRITFSQASLALWCTGMERWRQSLRHSLLIVLILDIIIVFFLPEFASASVRLSWCFDWKKHNQIVFHFYESTSTVIADITAGPISGHASVFVRSSLPVYTTYTFPINK
jgi:hypothetical protein